LCCFAFRALCREHATIPARLHRPAWGRCAADLIEARREPRSPLLFWRPAGLRGLGRCNGSLALTRLSLFGGNEFLYFNFRRGWRLRRLADTSRYAGQRTRGASPFVLPAIRTWPAGLFSAAGACGHPFCRLERMSQWLANHDRDLSNRKAGIAPLKRVLATVRARPRSARGTEGPPRRLELLASHSVEHLAPAIRIAGARARGWSSTWSDRSLRHTTASLGPASEIDTFQPEGLVAPPEKENKKNCSPHDAAPPNHPLNAS